MQTYQWQWPPTSTCQGVQISIFNDKSFQMPHVFLNKTSVDRLTCTKSDARVLLTSECC